MKIKAFGLALAMCLFPAMVHAQDGDVTQGVIVEGESLPIGVSLGDTFGEIEATISAIEEFDLSERFCQRLACTYTARDDQDEELGQVRVRFGFNAVDSTFTAISMRWTFEDWVTTAGLSLRALRDDVASQEELSAFYPEGVSLYRVRGDRRSAAISSRAAGVRMTSNETPTRSSAFGSIF